MEHGGAIWANRSGRVRTRQYLLGDSFKNDSATKFMNMPPDVRLRFDSCKPLYSRLERLLGMGSGTVDLFVAASSTERFKVVKLSRTGRESVAARARFQSCASQIARLKDVAAAPNLVHVDEETIVVEWVDGIPLHKVPLTESLSAQLAATCAGSIVDVGQIKSRDLAIALPHLLDTLSARGLISEKKARRISEVASDLVAVPEAEPEGLCFADAALKNYVIAHDGSIHYVDLFGIYPSLVGHNLMRHMFFLPPSLRSEFLDGFLYLQGDAHLEGYLPYHYLSYLVRIAFSKSAGGRGLVRRQRLRRSRRALEEIEHFVSANGDVDKILDRILNRNNYR